MQHRHLLPDEIDQLLDGESGFGVTPLKAHLDSCPDCSQKLADARIVVDALEDLQHFAPSPRFAANVMAQVQVVEPWHVAVTAGARRLVPESRPMRVVMAASASLMGLGLSASAVWLTLRSDVTLYAAGLAAGKARGALLDGAGRVIGDAFGQGALDAIRSGGTTSLAFGAAVLLTAVGVATVGLRAAATSARRARE
jgi:hypothetical protein